MPAVAVVIFCVSLAAQVVAAAMALRLIASTRYRTGWILTAVALLLMAVRRVIAFVSMRSSGEVAHVSASEALALVISVMFVMAMVLMSRYFRRIAASEHALREVEQRRDAILRAMVTAAHRFLGAASWEHVLAEVQGHLGRAADVSRVYVFRNVVRADGTMHVSQMAEWCAAGIRPDVHSEQLQDVAWSEVSLPEWTERLSRGDVVMAEVNTLPEPLRTFFMMSEIKSLLLVPVLVQEQWWGFMGFDECRYTRKWSHVEVDALRTAAAVLGSAIAHARDAQRVADRELRYRTLFDLIPSGIVLEQLDGTIIDVNRAFCTCFGYTRSELIGRSVRMLVTTEMQDTVTANLARLAGGERLHSVVTNVRKDGRHVNVELREVCLTLPDGSRVIVAVVNDVTEHVRMTAALQQSEERFRLIFECCTLGIATMELETQRFMQANPAMCRMLGYTAQEMTQLTLRDVTYAEDVEKELEAGQRLRESGTSYFTMRKRYVRRDGSIFWGQLTASLVRDAAGNPRYGMGIVEDITERLAHEQELLRAQKLESLGVLAGGIAHDFNNILTVILGNASLAKQLAVVETEGGAEVVHEIEQAAIRARGLTQQLLTFSQGGAPVKHLASLREIITESALFVARGSSVSCVFDMADDLWAVEVDTAQISQVFQNIVLNAVQAMPTGGTVTIRADNVMWAGDQRIPAGNYVRVQVSDTGVGIPDAYVARIFDPYFTTKKSGSGLGLTTALSVVKRHGGQIDVQRNESGGTTFIVYIPAQASAEKPARVAHKLPARLRYSCHGRILVMDDETPVRTLMARALQEAGYEVAVAASGEEAVAQFKAAYEHPPRFDAVILDLTVRGGIGGVEVLQQLRCIDPQIKAIVSSGYSSDPIMAQYRHSGFDGMVPKPFRIEDLWAEVGRVLELPSTRGAREGSDQS